MLPAGLSALEHMQYPADFDIAELACATADGFQAVGDLKKAKDLFEKYSEVPKALADQRPGEEKCERELAVAHSRMGDVLAALGELADARGFYERDLEISARLARSNPSSEAVQRDWALSLAKLGVLDIRSYGDKALARARLEKSLAILAARLAINPRSAQLPKDVEGVRSWLSRWRGCAIGKSSRIGKPFFRRLVLSLAQVLRLQKKSFLVPVGLWRGATFAAMRIALAQLNYHIGNFEGNLKRMLDAVEQARRMGADLVCFGELSVCGYPPRDFLEFDDFIRRCQASIRALCEASRTIGIVVGAPTRNPVIEGKDLYNSAYFLYEGEVIGLQHKALLPTYDIFDEYRYFEPAREFRPVVFQGHKIALTICEDIWNVGNDNPLYTLCPLDEMRPFSPDVVLNLSASPFHYGQAQERIRVVRANGVRYGVPLFYVNHVGAQTDLIFDGGSLVMAPDGRLFDEMPYFKECVRVYDLEEVLRSGRHCEQPKDKIALIHEALVLGIRDYFGKLGFRKAILGLSGGIDSAVACALAVEALGADNVHALLMPGPFSSEHSLTDARQLAEAAGIGYDIVPIEPIYEAFLQRLKPLFDGRPFDITEENLQARIRGTLLMAASNKMGYILLNTSNKSEMAVGYGTLYGDMCGGLSVLGDVYKTEVYALAHYLNTLPLGRYGQRGIIPQSSLLKPPSAELRPNQKDSDSLPDYETLDQVLFHYIEGRRGPRELVAMGFEENLVARVLRMVNTNEFKREQAPPVLRVSPKSFGMGRRMPIVGKYLS